MGRNAVSFFNNLMGTLWMLEQDRKIANSRIIKYPDVLKLDWNNKKL